MALTPQKEAGCRMLPPVSLPSVAIAIFAATAAALPSAAASGHALELPGIACDLKAAGFRGRAHSELIHIQLAQHHRAGLVQARDRRRVKNRHVTLKYLRAASGLHALGGEDIFDGDGDAQQGTLLARRPQLISRPRLLPRQFRRHTKKGADLRIALFDLRQMRLGQFQRADVAVAQELQCLGDGQSRQFGHSSHPMLSPVLSLSLGAT